MRGIFWVLLSALLGLAAPAMAQQAEAEPFSRANIVLVHTSVPADSVLACLKEYLVARGFLLDTLDEAQGLLTTTVAVPARRLAEQIKMRAVRSADGWKLTGLCTLEGPLQSGATAFPAQFLGLNSAPAKTVFREVEALARAIPRGTLRYARGHVRFGAFTPLDRAIRLP